MSISVTTGNYLEFTSGNFAGDGAFTFVALVNPTGSSHGVMEALSGGVPKAALLSSSWRLFGNDDYSAGVGPIDVAGNSPGWQVWALVKGAGSSTYRMHYWDYDPAGTGTMVHDVSSGAGNHPDYATADLIRVGRGATNGQGYIAAAMALDRACTDAELDTLVSTSLSSWAALSPDFGVELSAWDGTAGANVFAGTSTLSAEVGTVPSIANPTGFNFGLAPPNAPPTVDAGANQSTLTGSPVTLTATAGDTDGTVASYAWTQISGPAVTLAGTGASRTFTPSAAGVRVFRVTVTDDDGATATDTVQVTTADIPNVPPTVNGGPNRSILVGATTTLAATSADTDGTIASVTWSQISGPAATLGGSGATRTFTPTAPGTYVFSVVAVDDDGDSSTPDTVSVLVSAPAPSGAVPLKMAPFHSIEQAVMALIQRDFSMDEDPLPEEQVGGDFGYDPDTMPWYVRIDKVPGGSSDRHGGVFIIDLEVFGADYLLTESVAYALEALVLGYPHVVEVGGRKVVFDDVTQNVGVADLPWEDDSTYRLGATYVITARRR